MKRDRLSHQHRELVGRKKTLVSLPRKSSNDRKGEEKGANRSQDEKKEEMRFPRGRGNASLFRKKTKRSLEKGGERERLKIEISSTSVGGGKVTLCQESLPWREKKREIFGIEGKGFGRRKPLR